MRPYKCMMAPPFTAQRWHALFYVDGQWHELRDEAGFVADFATPRAAINAAKQRIESTKP